MLSVEVGFLETRRIRYIGSCSPLSSGTGENNASTRAPRPRAPSSRRYEAAVNGPLGGQVQGQIRKRMTAQTANRRGWGP